METSLQNCIICNRQLLDDGNCLYCTTSDALNLRHLVPDHLLESPPPEKVRCLVQPTTGRKFTLDCPRLRIGRDPKSQIVLEDVYVSRHHAFITYEDGQFWIEDLGSKNGTQLNGAHILDREVINPGDVLSFGHAEFIVE